MRLMSWNESGGPMPEFLHASSQRVRACLVCVGAAFLVPSAAAQNAAIPVLSAPGSGWLEVGDDFLAPPSGPGPVTAEPAHPYHSNLSGLQPTYRVADLHNPILQPSVVERLRQNN